MNIRLLIVGFFWLFVDLVSSQWLAIDDYSVSTWNEKTADRPKILTKFEITNYPSKYVRSLNNQIDTYTFDRQNRVIYFIMQQDLYGISKFLKYTSLSNQIDQTKEVQQFMIDQIQYNSVSNRLFAIIHNTTSEHYLVEIDKETLQVKRAIITLQNFASPMPGSYFDSVTQFFTYHAYDFKQQDTVLITLDLSNNASKIFIRSIKFDYNVYAFGYIQQRALVALWQYNIVTPMVCIKLNVQSGKQIRNVTITPVGVRIAEGYKPFSIDSTNRQFYVLSSADDFSTVYISKIQMDTLQLEIITIPGQTLKDYLFIKQD